MKPFLKHRNKIIFFFAVLLLPLAGSLSAEEADADKEPAQAPDASIQVGSNPGVSAWAGWGADPWEELRRMNRLMNQMLGNAFSSAYGQRPARMMQGAVAGGDFNPDLDVRETASAYIVEADIPGMDKNKIDITVRDDVLTIRGVREEVETREEETESGAYFYKGRSFGSFQRSFNLPGNVKDEEIAAAYENGVLKITLPKAEKEAVPEGRKIEVR